MNLWIAIAAGLSLAQGQSESPYPSPTDPSVRDPAASALRDANEQAAEAADGAWLPPNYVIQPPMADGTIPYVGDGYDITPVLPDGEAPATSGQVAVDETYQRYEAIPAQVQEGTGGSGTEDSEGTTSTDDTSTAVGGSGSVTTGQTSTSSDNSGDARVSQPGGSNTEAVAPSSASQAGGIDGDASRDSTGGSGTTGTTDSSGVGTTQPDMQGSTGGSGTTVPTEGTGTGTSTQPSMQDGTGGSGTSQDSLGGFGPTESEQTHGQGGSGSSTTTPVQPQQQSSVSGQQTGNVPANAAASAQASKPAPTQEELSQLRARLQQVEEELKARDNQIEQNAQATQQQVDTFGERAVDTERSRQQRLSALQSAGEWMLAADAALQQGEDDVGNALDIADSAFADLRDSAAEFGQGTVIVHAERARALLNLARDAAGRSDTYSARLALQDAGVELSLARSASLGRSGTGNSLLSP
ncbi:hypothetical protein ACN469_08085 [Corallococcus terminator]